MIDIKIDGQKVQISGKGSDGEILADSIAAIVTLAYRQAEELQLKPQNALFTLYQLAAKYLNKVDEMEDKKND